MIIIDEKFYLIKKIKINMSKRIITVRRKSIHDKYVNIKKDLPNIIFLIFLYFLQAVCIHFLFIRYDLKIIHPNLLF